MADPAHSPQAAPEDLPDRVRMPLLTLITQQSLDEDYVHAAERRLATGAPQARTGSHRVAAVVVAVFGILIAIAAVQTSRNADVEDASRTTLLKWIGERRDLVARQQDRISALRGQITELDQHYQAAAEGAQEASTRELQLETVTGFGAVQGPGMRMTVDDSEDGNPEGRVRAGDLRMLVNGLWQAGAEAIAINGHRLINTGAITNAGLAVQVNRRPMSPPYVVSAIGDRRTLQGELFLTTAGLTFQATAMRFGFQTSRQNVDSMSLPAAPARLRLLRFAQTMNQDPPDDPRMEDEKP